MLQKFEITAVHLEADDILRAYARKKLGTLDRYIPRAARASAHLEVWLREVKADGWRQPECDAVLHVPHETISLSEVAPTMNIAIDKVKARLRQRIKQYKDESANGGQQRHMFSRLKRTVTAVLPRR